MGVYFVELSDLDTIPPAETAEEQLAWDVVFATPPQQVVGVQGSLEANYADPYGSAGGGGYNAQTLNKAWQTTGTPQWVYWRTTNPDPTGVSFPGPGVFGTTTNYAVETIVYVAV